MKTKAQRFDDVKAKAQQVKLLLSLASSDFLSRFAGIGILISAGRLDNRKGNMMIALTILGLVFAVIVSLIGVLVGAVTTAKMDGIFEDLGINATSSPDWYQLKVDAVDYSTTAIGIAIVGLILTGVLALLSVVMGFFGAMTGGGRRGGGF